MTVHQIWIGHKPLPEPWIATVRDFCKAHGHTHRLWDNAAVSLLDLGRYPGLPELLAEYQAGEQHFRYAGIADILRNVILYEQGGIYLDADMVVVNGPRFAQFLQDMESRIFYGWEDDHGLIANSVIGCPRGHAYMAQCLDLLPRHAAAQAGKPVWMRTGPVFVTEAHQQLAHLFEGAVDIVPKHYFYPRSWHGIQTVDAHWYMSFEPDTMLFQYGYTTNDMGRHFEHWRG